MTKPSTDPGPATEPGSTSLQGSQAMTEQWTLTQVADHLNVNPKSADKQLRRWNIPAVARQPGRGGQNLYDASAVRQAAKERPGRGRRSDLQR